MLQKIKLCDIELTVTYSYYYDPGCHTTASGDPGWPETEELVIEKIRSNEDITSLLDSYSRTATIYADIKEKLLPYARESNKN